MIQIHHVKPMLESPMKGIATPVADAVTSEQVMQRANLDWRVLEKNLQTTDDQPLAVDSHKALVRADTQKLLGVVGQGFEVLQNAEAFAFCDGLVARGKIEYISAGQLNDGKRIFIQCKLVRDGGSSEIAKGDFVDPYFLMANGHDGSLAVRSLMTPIRVICQNTFKMALSKGANGHDSVSIKHTKNLQERLEAAKELFGWAEQSFDDFVGMAKATVAKKITTEQKLREFFRETFKVEEAKILDEDSNTRLKTRENRLADLFMDGAGQQNTAIRGTAWAAVNAVTQYLDHEASTAVRGIDFEGVGSDERTRLTRMKRFESNTLGGNARIKQRALELALAL